MSDLQLHRPNLGYVESRRVSRALGALSTQTSLAVATVQARAEIEATKVDAVAHVGQRAMQNVALLTQMEQQLAQAVPLASGRLATIADMAALGMAEVVAGTIRHVQRG